MIWGQVAALTTAVCWSLTAVAFSKSGRLIGAAVVNRSRLLFAFAYLLLTHWLLEGTLFPWGTEPFRWGWFAISSILGLALGDTFLFQAYVLIGPRLSMLLMACVPIISAIFGWILFGELITMVEWTAVFLTVGGIAWVVTERPAGQTAVENKQYKKGIFFGLLGALGQVANLVTARYGLIDDYSPLSATVIRILVAIIILWAVAIWQGEAGGSFRAMRQNRRAFWLLQLGTISGPFLGIWMSLIAVQLARLGIASTLMALPPILLIPLEYLIERKPVSSRAIIGTLVAFGGVALIFLN